MERRAADHSRLALRLYRSWVALEAACGTIDLARDACPSADKKALMNTRDRVRNQATKLKTMLDAQLEKPINGTVAQAEG